MKQYDIPFSEVMNLLLEGKWLRGNLFASGFYIKLDHIGQLVLVDANNFYRETPFCQIQSLANNKFRVLRIATIKELTDEQSPT